jgi:ribosomal protein S18 acetylase RimI-like enzyme
MRDVTSQDSAELLEWRNEIGVRKFSHNQEPISERDHASWLFNRLKTLTREPFWVFEEGLDKVGIVRFDFKPEFNHFAISIIINPSLRGRGYGKIILNKAIEKYLESNPKANFHAEVHKDNVASKILFLDAGFQEITAEKKFLIFKRIANFN